VVVARPGLAEPVESRGQEWLVAELDDVLEKVRS
jgi:hypothetical protein